MARLVYSMITSLDGYVADDGGSFGWAAPDEDLHAFVNDLERPVGTYLYGRRMYEVMRFWEDAQHLDDPSPVFRDFAQVWQAADKVVYSRTLESVATARTRLEPRFEPEAVRQLKETTPLDISVAGPELAAQALLADLVDECHFFVTPVVVGGGTACLPRGLRAQLELVDEHRFGSGVVHLHYRLAPGLAPVAGGG